MPKERPVKPISRARNTKDGAAIKPTMMMEPIREVI